jgi:cytochrome c-type biogenesis protein CcmH/NrfG
MSIASLLRRVIAVFTALSLVACTSMQARQVGAAEPLTTQLKVGDEVEIKAANGKTYLLTLTEVSGDKLVGVGDNKKVTISRQQIETLEVRKFSAAKTAGLTAGTLVVLYAVVAVLAFAAFGKAMEDLFEGGNN